MKWHDLNPDDFKPEIFGLSRIYKIQCAIGYGTGEIHCFTRKGWSTFAELLDYNPITMKPIEFSQWWIFAAKGEPTFKKGGDSENVRRNRIHAGRRCI